MTLFLLRHDDIYAAGDESDCGCAHWEICGVFSTEELAIEERERRIVQLFGAHDSDNHDEFDQQQRRYDIEKMELDKPHY